jgi:hypothetical protein
LEADVNRYQFKRLDPGVYVIIPIGDSPPVKAGRCIIGYRQAYLTRIDDTKWLVENISVELDNTPDYENTVAFSEVTP